MKRIIYILLVSVVVAFIVQDSHAAEWKKKKNKKNKAVPEMQRPPVKRPSAYERLFQGKQVTTEDGLMKIHALKDHGRDQVYVEFPLRLLGKDMMLTSSIEEISDSGEGAVGQFNNFVQLRFTRLDSNLLVRLIMGDEPVTTAGDANIEEALRLATQPGVWQMMKILAYSPDSTAVVVDMTRLFMEHSDYVSPFASFGGNSMGGFSQRIQRPRPDKNVLRGVKAYEKSILVTGEYNYFVDHKFMGQQVFRKNVPVTVTANRILMLLPEDVMRPRYADVRVGVTMLPKSGIAETDKGFVTRPYTMRWRLEPSDAERYKRGELVEPKKPIVFYMDTLIPADWKQPIKDAAESWNPVFEKIGFKNVIRVVEFPKNDSSFNANDIENSVIRYASTWMIGAQNSMHSDLRSGEILNASILVHNGIGIMLSDSYKAGALGLDPESHTNGLLPEATRYELMRAYMTPIFGNALGLTGNYKAVSAFPLDSLRSPSFTQKYGIAPSAMIPFMFNVVARAEDVSKGVRLIPKGPGECDYFTMKWLYSPIPEVKTAEEEVAILEKWVAEEENNRNCQFGYDNKLMSDATYASRVPGDDQLKAVQYYLENVKRFFAHLDEWYKEGDPDFSKRAEYIGRHTAEIPMTMRILANYIGGFSVNYRADGTTLDFVPKARQKEVLKYCLKLVKDFSWVDVPEFEKQAGMMDNQSHMLTWGIMTRLLSRVEQLFFSEEKNKDGYTSKEFAEDLYREIWKPTRDGRALTEMERNMQKIFLGSIITSAGIAPAPAPAAGGQAPQQVRQGMADPVNYVATYRKLWGNSLFPEEYEAVGGELFVPALSSLKVARYPVQHWYFDMLLRTKDLIRKAVNTSTGESRMHYEYMLMKINNVLD